MANENWLRQSPRNRPKQFAQDHAKTLIIRQQGGARQATRPCREMPCMPGMPTNHANGASAMMGQMFLFGS